MRSPDSLPLDEDEIAFVRRTQIDIGAVALCGDCGQWQPVTAFARYAATCCNECVVRRPARPESERDDAPLFAEVGA